jgi:hypothetical protein
MAYQLSGYTDVYGVAQSAAYLRVTSTNIEHRLKQTIVSYAIYATATTADDGKSLPLASASCTFYDSSDGNTLLYTNNFVCALGTDPFGTQPTNVNDMLTMQAYLALKNHSSMTTLLSGATAV